MTLDAAWAEAQAALPERASLVRLTWRIGMHEKFPPDEDFEARAEWWTEHDRMVESTYAATPVEALRKLADRLAQRGVQGEVLANSDGSDSGFAA